MASFCGNLQRPQSSMVAIAVAALSTEIPDQIHHQKPTESIHVSKPETSEPSTSRALSHSVQDFYNHATCLVGKFETVDSYYRHCSSVSFVRGVSVPLLCISALDDPVCTREAIPWDECRVNKNIVLATLPHGGHLGFFEGITAHSLWYFNIHITFSNICNSLFLTYHGDIQHSIHLHIEEILQFRYQPKWIHGCLLGRSIQPLSFGWSNDEDWKTCGHGGTDFGWM